MFLIKFLGISILALTSSCVHQPNFGIPADTLQVDLASIPDPILSHSKKSFCTDNQFGFDVIQRDSNWITRQFLSDLKPGMVVLDVGAGYGALTRAALNKQAIVISNEISHNQQLYNLKHLSKSSLSRLYLNDSDVRKMILPSNSLDAIIFHRVLHFFSGQEIENILTKSKKWLKPKGKIYIVMMSKEHIAFQDLIDYDETKVWPGEDLVIVSKHLPEQAYALPSHLHVISLQTMRKNVSKLGFKIEKLNYVSLKQYSSKQTHSGREAIGLIGTK